LRIWEPVTLENSALGRQRKTSARLKRLQPLTAPAIVGCEVLKQLKHDEADSPKINSLVVVFLQKHDLWCAVAPGCHVARQLALFKGQCLFHLLDGLQGRLPVGTQRFNRLCGQGLWLKVELLGQIRREDLFGIRHIAGLTSQAKVTNLD
jgi:hypothetical protein